MIDYAGPSVEPSWQTALGDVNGAFGDQISWLKLVWVPGAPWEPVERWMIYQMVPRSRINPLVMPSLLGPDPRNLGYWDKVKGEWVGDPTCFVDHTQWKLFRETGCYGRPLWVVQGDNGGHKYRLDRLESAISRTRGGPPDTPSAGDLPYAAPDMRAFGKLAGLDKLRQYKRMLDYMERKPEDFDAEDEQTKQQIEDVIFEWMGGKIQQYTPEMAWAINRAQA